jgi:hypothetical protein
MMNITLRFPGPVALLLALSPFAAHAMSVDVKNLARYDLSYVQCEAQYPQMKGQRDQAYLSLYRTRADKQSLADLAKARKSEAYKAERAAALKAAPNGVLPASSPLSQQCEALWAEARKMQANAAPPPKKP